MRSTQYNFKRSTQYYMFCLSIVVVKPKIVISWFHSFYKVMDFDLIWFKSVFENSAHTLRAPVRCGAWRQAIHASKKANV